MTLDSTNINSSNFLLCFCNKILTKETCGRGGIKLTQLKGYSLSSKEVTEKKKLKTGMEADSMKKKVAYRFEIHDILSYLSFLLF